MSKIQFDDGSDAVTLLKLKKFYDNLLAEIANEYEKKDDNGFLVNDEWGYTVLNYVLKDRNDTKLELDDSGYIVLKEVKDGN